MSINSRNQKPTSDIINLHPDTNMCDIPPAQLKQLANKMADRAKKTHMQIHPEFIAKLRQIIKESCALIERSESLLNSDFTIEHLSDYDLLKTQAVMTMIAVEESEQYIKLN